jgi:hypothetical protein
MMTNGEPPHPPIVVVDQRVTSNSQSGGITAHTVNIVPQAFELTDKIISEVIAEIGLAKKVRMHSYGSMSRDLPMAQRLLAAIGAKGYAVEHTSHVGQSSDPPPKGIGIKRLGDEVDLTFNPT